MTRPMTVPPRRTVPGLAALLAITLALAAPAEAQKFGRNCLADGGTDCTALIPDGAGMLASTVTIPAGCTSVARVCLALGVEHSQMSDVSIRLSHGATTVLIAKENTSPDLRQATVLETEFDGQDGSGIWTLTLQDGIAGDYGALNNWTLGLCCGADCGDGLVRVDPVSGLVTTESGGTDQFGIELTCPPFHEVTVDGIATADPTEGIPDVASVSFTAANATMPAIVTATGQDDPLLDGDQPYVITIGGTTTGAPFTLLLPADLYNPPSVYGGLDVPNVDLLNLDDEVDLAIDKTLVAVGPPAIYTITATNEGPETVSGATVTDNFPVGLTCTWTCMGTNGGMCTPGPVAGNINDMVTLPAGASVTYTASCAYAGTVNLGNTATVAPPTGSTDIDPDDNTGSVVPAALPAPAPALDAWGLAVALLMLGALAWRRMKRIWR